MTVFLLISKGCSRSAVLYCLTLVAFYLISFSCADAGEPDMENFWTGDTSNSGTFQIIIARSHEEWKALWHIAGRTPPRELNVLGEMAVGVFLGERRTGGYSVSINSTRTGSVFEEIHFSEKRPGKNAFVPQVLTTPYAIQIVKRSQLPLMVLDDKGKVYTTENEIARLEGNIDLRVKRCEEWGQDVIRHWKQKCDDGSIGPAPWLYE